MITDVHAVAVPVADQDRAVAFFTGVLGFGTVLDAWIDETMRWVELAPAGASTSVALVAAGDARPAAVDTGIRFSTADAAAAHDSLRAAGVTVGELLRGEYAPPMFTFDDPDGNRYYLVELPEAGLPEAGLPEAGPG
jgi:catechol 2,3-dioxygenase-like lactoylglutathione lyase family enzyme